VHSELNITFTKEEQNVLDLGLQHNIEKPLKAYWMNMITETENAIKLNILFCHFEFRIMASKKLRQIYNTKNNVHTEHKRHNYTLNRMKKKSRKTKQYWHKRTKEKPV